MGYCMNLREASFKMKKENVAPCLKAMETFAKADTLEKALGEWRWDIEMDKDGSVDGISFSGEKSGDDTKLFEAIAPYVESGSYIEMGGEDGAIWRWKFNGRKCIEEGVTLDWEDNTEIVQSLLKEKKILPTLLGVHPTLDRRIGEVLKGGKE